MSNEIVQCECPLSGFPTSKTYYIPFFNVEKRQMEMIITNQAGYDKYKKFSEGKVLILDLKQDQYENNKSTT